MNDYNAGEAVLTDEQVAQMQVPELKDELRRRRLRLAGRKRELVARLLAAVRLEREHGTREEYDDDDDDDEMGVIGDRLDGNDPGNHGLSSQVRVTPVGRRRRQDERKCTVLTFEDVEGSLKKFSGDDLLNVTQWIRDFEEMAEVCGWSDIHMVVFARKLLTGSAQAFVRQERCMKSWAKFKMALVDEFEDVVSDRQVHQELARRTKRADESLLQYMYSMREIAGQGRVDTQSIIDYIIQGIPDEVTNKAILYGARNMQQLKERFKQYEAMKRDMKAKTKFGERKNDKAERPAMRNQSKQTSSDPKRCFNCGGDDHLSVTCPKKEKGVRCFSCNEFGHVAAKCTARPKESYVISRPEKKEHVKEVSIDDYKITSLVDTGSDLTFMRSDVYARLGSPPLGGCRYKVKGFGSADNETWGEFTKVMTADGHEFSVTAHVVSSKVLGKHSLLLGTDFLDQIELQVKRGEVIFLRLDEQTDDFKDAPDISRVNIEQTDKVDSSHVQEPHCREVIRDIVRLPRRTGKGKETLESVS